MYVNDLFVDFDNKGSLVSFILLAVVMKKSGKVYMVVSYKNRNRQVNKIFFHVLSCQDKI